MHGPPPESVSVVVDGRQVGALDWGGSGPALLLMHPNGFCAGMYDPLARRLRDRYRPFAVDIRGHGSSDPPRDDAEFSLVGAASDVAAVLRSLGIEEVVAFGHSSGGACVILLDRAAPGVLRAALLGEPIAFPPTFFTGSGADGANIRARAARRRRAVWPDRATVVDSYGSRPPLDVLAPEVLAAYVQWGFRERVDGAVELVCAPEVEAAWFESVGDVDDGARAAFAHLPALGGRATIAYGERSDFGESVFAAQARALGTPALAVKGDHFFPHEDLDRMEALIDAHLG